jgi:CBS domain containing-hemolysin-like protein
MVELATAARLVGGVVLLLSNGFFVTTEFALTRVRQFSEDEFQGRGLGLAWEMTERLEIYLSGCQVGITISSVGLGVVAEPALAAVLDPLVQAFGVAPADGGHTAAAVIVSLTIINLLHVIIGEQAPTYLGIERTRFVAKYGAPLLYAWTKVMWPVIKLSDWVAKAILGLFGVQIDRSWTEEELEDVPTTRGDVRRQMGDALGSVDIPEERQQEVMGALDIGRIPVRDVMVPREDILAVRTTDSVDANVDRMAGSPHVRFPLVGDGLDDYRGVVYMPPVLEALDDLRAGDTTFEDLAAPPLTIDPDTVVSDAIDTFQDEGQELALVTDGDEVVGLLTATDAFEQITGDLEDPMDSEASGTDPR